MSRMYSRAYQSGRLAPVPSVNDRALQSDDSRQSHAVIGQATTARSIKRKPTTIIDLWDAWMHVQLSKWDWRFGGCRLIPKDTPMGGRRRANRN